MGPRQQFAKKIIVRMKNGETIIAESMPGSPTMEWREYPFTLEPTVSADNATLQIGAEGSGMIWFDQASVMSQSSKETGGYRPDLLQAITDLKPPVIRWPGGCYVNEYRWKESIGAQSERVSGSIFRWDDRDVNSYGTDEFIAMCRKTGSEPVIVVNLGDSTNRQEFLQEALDWIEYCNGPATSKWGSVRAANGHVEPYNVKYWEIGNEQWGPPQIYIDLIKLYSPAMRAVDPSISLIACGSGQLGEWWHDGDIRVIKECGHLIDYLSVHNYEDVETFDSGPDRAEKFFAEFNDLIAESKNPDLKLYMSEWNLRSTDLRTGIYAAGLLNVFERTSIMGMASPALFLRHVSAPGWDNAFVNFDHSSWFAAPNYIVMKLWHDNFAPNRVSISGDAGVLNTVATKSDDGTQVFFKSVNPTDQPVSVELKVNDSFAVSKAKMEIVTAESPLELNSLDNPNNVRVTELRVKQKGNTINIVLPPWTAGVLKFSN